MPTAAAREISQPLQYCNIFQSHQLVSTALSYIRLTPGVEGLVCIAENLLSQTDLKFTTIQRFLSSFTRNIEFPFFF